MPFTLHLVYPLYMDRNIKVIGEREEKVRVLLRPIESETASRAFRYYGITKPLYNGIFFAHMEKEEKLGAFLPSDEIIILSEELLNYPIGVIKNIFLHECAHAVDHIFNPSMTGHSSYFRDICDKLGVEKGFEKAKLKEDITLKAKKREKLDKLMALTSSSFENEALIALEKARELIEKAKLEDDMDSLEKEEKIYMVDLYEKKRIATYITYISAIVTDSTGTYNVKNHTGESVILRAYGSLEQCESALYLFDYLLCALDNEVARLRKSGKKISKDSFMVGVYDAIRKKTEKSSSTELVKSIKDENKYKAKKLVFKDSTITSKASRVNLDSGSFSSGSSFGESLDLSADRQKKITS